MTASRSTRTRIGYGCGSLVTGAYTTLPGLLLLPYLTDTLGAGAVLAGAVVLVPKAWAVVLAPAAGRAADRTGARRTHLLLGGLAAAAGLGLMLSGPAAGGAGVAWTALGFLLTATAFAFFQAAFAALPAELADRPEDRMRLVGSRVAGIAVAALAVGAAAPALVEATGGGLPGHRWAALFGAAVMALGTLAVHSTTRRLPRPTPATPGREPAASASASPASGREPAASASASPASGREPAASASASPASGPALAASGLATAAPSPASAAQTPAPEPAVPAAGPAAAGSALRRLSELLRRNPGFAALLACATVQVIATGCLLAAAPYFAEHVLGTPDTTPLLVAAFVAPNLFSPPLWTRIAARRGNRAALTAASAVLAGGSLLLTAAPGAPAWWAPAALLLAGVGHAGQLLLLYAMLTECAAQDRSGAGTLSGLFSGGEALGMALGPFLFALLLQLTGYVPSDTGSSAAQSATAEWGVLAGMSVLPALLTAAGLVLLHARGRARKPGFRESAEPLWRASRPAGAPASKGGLH
ncbi:MFS transporter [Streptomyces sp. NPDC085524]|uniref:MFS transporter n=1 Tax=Streptomyces sp. NPDC085524 TaxID=3365728 RepID=UPI0037D0BAFD